MDKKVIFVFDIDNTLVNSINIYDEAYKLTSKEFTGKEFIMTKNPDGSADKTFSKLSNYDILKKRADQLGIKVDPKGFFKLFDKNAEELTKKIDVNVFPYLREFLEELSKKYYLLVLTSGTKKFQMAVLKKNNLSKFFDLKNSLFLGDYNIKKDALQKISSKFNPQVLIHLGDSPKDIIAIKDANINCKKIAVGVSISKLVSEKELLDAGPDYIINEYNKENLINLIKKVS